MENRIRKNFQKITTTSFLVFLLALSAAAPLMAENESAADGGNRVTTLNPGNYSFWKNVQSPNQFANWRKEIVAFYRRVTGIKPDYAALPLDTKIVESIDIGNNVTRRKIEYSTAEGLRIPAYLFIPKTDKPVPAIIVYHGHGPGKICAAEGGGTNENALARDIALKLGYVVLAPDSRSFGEFKIPKAKSHADYYFSLLSKGKLYMAKLMEDGYQDIALLRATPQADVSRLGVAGISMGSWRAFNFAALHEEARAAVIAGLYIPWEFLFSGKHCRCQHMPKLASKIAAEDLAATIFPRDLMIQWGQKDSYYQMDAEGLIDRTKKIADFLGYQDHFFVDRHPDMGHRFSNPEIAEFFHARFGDGAWAPQ